MKVAVLLAAPWIPGSVDMTEYLCGLEALGHEATMICLDRSEGPAGYRVVAAGQEALESSAFYEELGLDGVIAFTWLNNDNITRAMRSAGMRVLLRGDTDGMISVRHFPSHHLRARLSVARGLIEKAAGAKHWVERYAIQSRAEDRARERCLAAADVIVVETEEAAANVTYFLRRRGRMDLSLRLRVVPHLVANPFIESEVPARREEVVTCVGRWEDAQKNAPLLAETIELHLSRNPGTVFQIIGPDSGCEHFDGLIARRRQVRFLGRRKPSEVLASLAASRVLLSASRWEGAPVVANEALALGTTVVGTPISAFIDIAKRQRCGTVAARHTARALAAALAEELAHWREGRRDPIAISMRWRPRLAPRAVIGELASLLFPQRKPAFGKNAAFASEQRLSFTEAN
jgi:glycosyltransferase involved in cell wall biosynthesis